MGMMITKAFLKCSLQTFIFLQSYSVGAVHFLFICLLLFFCTCVWVYLDFFSFVISYLFFLCNEKCRRSVYYVLIHLVPKGDTKESD